MLASMVVEAAQHFSRELKLKVSESTVHSVKKFKKRAAENDGDVKVLQWTKARQTSSSWRTVIPCLFHIKSKQTSKGGKINKMAM